MMALVRFIYDFLRKEESLVADYIRNHRHCKVLITLDALLTVSLVLGGFAYASASSRNATKHELLSIGASAISSSEFVDHIRTQGVTVYWLGASPGNNISYDERQMSVHSLSYALAGSSAHDLDRQEITIVTYCNSTDSRGMRHFGTRIDLDTTVTANGLIIQYDENTMTDELVKINGTFNTVSIHYPTPQTLDTLQGNAMALRLVA